MRMGWWECGDSIKFKTWEVGRNTEEDNKSQDWRKLVWRITIPTFCWSGKWEELRWDEIWKGRTIIWENTHEEIATGSGTKGRPSVKRRFCRSSGVASLWSGQRRRLGEEEEFKLKVYATFREVFIQFTCSGCEALYSALDSAMLIDHILWNVKTLRNYIYLDRFIG